jgi:3-deoxy-D-manno-octulosonic-acid transferase
MIVDKHFLYLIYFIASLKAGILGWPYFWWHLQRRGKGESFFPRLGLKIPKAGPPPGFPRLWVHGVSVGEILTAAPLVQELRSLLPQAAFIITTGTETGQALARKHFAPLGAYVCYFPLDLPWAVHRYLRHLKPDVFIALESELWPNFLVAAHRQGIKMALLNARLSERSFRRFSLLRNYVVDIFDLFAIIAAGSPQDYDRLGALGVPQNKLKMTGNLKIDRLLAQRGSFTPLPSSPAPEFPGAQGGKNLGQTSLSGAAAALNKVLNLTEHPVFLAASTHPGEEGAVLEAYQHLLAPYPSLILILAPRHPERAEEIGRLLAQRGLGFQRWSCLKNGQESRREPVVVIDTIGDLMNLYGVADLAFVGGSLIPHGGQNILEPAAWGIAPLYGPHISNFFWARDILDAAGAGLMVRDAASLAGQARNLLDHPELRRDLGARALASLTPHQGAAKRQAKLIAQLI